MKHIDVCFTYGNDTDDDEDFWETRGIVIKDSLSREDLLVIKPQDITHEELIVNLLGGLGYSVDNVTNNLEDWRELNECSN